MSRIFMLPAHSGAVREYRFHRAAKYLSEFHDIYDMSKGASDSDGITIDVLQKAIAREGVDFDVFWTNHYGSPARSMAEVFREGFRKVVVDIDDWFWEVPDGNLAVDAWQGKRKKWYQELLDTATQITCSTKKLADRVGGALCHNFIDPQEWYFGDHYGKHDVIPRNEHDYTLIVSCSGTGRIGDLERVRPALEEALKRPDVKCLFFNFLPEWALKYPTGKIVYSRWAPIETYRNIMWHIKPDILISPMEHNEFNEAKSNLKWLEAGATKACFMGERWGEYDLHVEDGVTGVLSGSEEEWTQNLLDLCDNPVRRHDIAVRGQVEVLKNWTWPAVSEAWSSAVAGEGRRVAVA